MPHQKRQAAEQPGIDEQSSGNGECRDGDRQIVGSAIVPPDRDSDDGGVDLGPIPPDTPVGLLASLNLRPEGLGFWGRVQYDWKLLDLVKEIKQKLKALPANATDDQVKQAFAPLADSLIALSKCPDYVVNRGHYFGTGRYGDDSPLTEQQKRDLIEFLKTF